MTIQVAIADQPFVLAANTQYEDIIRQAATPYIQLLFGPPSGHLA
jgi:hypothetical protein